VIIVIFLNTRDNHRESTSLGECFRGTETLSMLALLRIVIVLDKSNRPIMIPESVVVVRGVNDILPCRDVPDVVIL